VLFLFLADTINAVFDVIYVYDALIINFSKSILHRFTVGGLISTEPSVDNAEYLSKATWGAFFLFFSAPFVLRQWRVAVLSLWHRPCHDCTPFLPQPQPQTCTSRFYLRVLSQHAFNYSLHGA
jgi:hypothetical protein